LTCAAGAAAQGSGSAAGGVPLVVAVDTSRSLTPAQLAEVVTRLEETLPLLPEETGAGLLIFDDAPRWLVPLEASPARLAGALPGLRPQGEHTQLNDALFFAVRALEGGGVVLLVTDGRDEDSATTVDDIARRCEAQGVRILALGAGSRVDRRSLRRLALLSDGTYLGTVGEVAAPAIAGAVAAARTAVGVERDRLRPPPPALPAPQISTPPPPPPAVAESDGGRLESPEPSWRRPVVAGGGMLLAAALAFLLWRRRLKASRHCPRCGSELDAGGDCTYCAAEERRRRLEEVPVLAPGELQEVSDKTVLVDRLALDEQLEETRLLTQQLLLEVRERGAPPRLYALDDEHAVAIGRNAEGNTLFVPDPALSAHHLKIVPRGGGRYELLDLGSTNGTFVNGERRQLATLVAGDVVTAGHLELKLIASTDPLR